MPYFPIEVAKNTELSNGFVIIGIKLMCTYYYVSIIQNEQIMQSKQIQMQVFTGHLLRLVHQEGDPGNKKKLHEQ